MIDRFTGDYKFLSNFYPSPIQLGLFTYPTVEHAFHAAKTDDPTWIRKIREAQTPGQAKKLGHQLPLRSDWDQVRLSIMQSLIYIKFTDPELKAKLLATGEDELVEGNTWNDKFWGLCSGVGQNHLGKILMKVRKDIVTKQGE